MVSNEPDFFAVAVGVKSLVEHDIEVLKVLKVDHFQDIFVFVMYYAYVMQGSSVQVMCQDPEQVGPYIIMTLATTDPKVMLR